MQGGLGQRSPGIQSPQYSVSSSDSNFIPTAHRPLSQAVFPEVASEGVPQSVLSLHCSSLQTMELWVVSHLIQQENQQRKFWIPHMRYRGFTLGKPFPSLQAEARACLVAPLRRDLLSYLSLSPQSEVCTSARHTCTCEKEWGWSSSSPGQW